MFAWDISFWWCCLNSREREVLRLTVEGLVLTLYVGIPKPLWDAFWVPHIGNGYAVRGAFLSIYKLDIVEIVIDEVPVEVVRPEVGWEYIYLSWAGFLLTSEAACLAGCEQSVYPK